MSPISPLSILLSVSFTIHYVHSQCSDLNADQSTCEADGYCTFANSDCVCGQTTWNQDIAFLFDSSMDPLEWFYTTKFAADLLHYGSPSTTTTRAAIFITGSSVIDTTTALSFGDESLTTTIDTTLPDLIQSTQADFYLQKGLQTVVDTFTTLSSTSTRKILIVFASELYHIDEIPCQVNVRSHDIYTYTITMGGWDTYGLLCVGSSENNYEGLLSVADAEQLTDDLLNTMEAITCPHHPLLKVTEIQLSGVSGEQYIEIYNHGHDINDMSQVTLNGFASGPLNGNVPLNQGGIGVIYNTDSSKVAQTAIPDCANCACTEDTNTVSEGSIKWCETAVYYGCCESGKNRCNNDYTFETAKSDCIWNSGLDMISFNIELKWGSITLDSVQYDANREWPLVDTGYALELKNKGYNNDFGSSWVMSCDADGTPGDNYLSTNCNYDCTVDGNVTCDINGGMWLDLADPEPGCVFATKSCNCLPGYYSHYHTCLPLPKPSVCKDIQVTIGVSNLQWLIAEWDGDTAYKYQSCEHLTGCFLPDTPYTKTGTNLIRVKIYSPGREINNTLLSVLAVGSDGNEWIGETELCNATTADPTMSPTASPTFSVPQVPSCTISLSADLKSFDITWEAIDMMQFNDTAAGIDKFNGYVYYYNDERRSNAVPCCTDSGTTPGSVMFNLTLPDNVTVSGDWDSILTDVSQLDELISSTLCNVTTQEPTPSPTVFPTKYPTETPSKSPSKYPTKSPTLRELYVPECSAGVLPKTTTLNMSWVPASFGADTALDTDTNYIIEWEYSTDRAPGFQIVSADKKPRPIQVIDYLNVTLLQMHCTWAGSTQYGRKTNCTINTVAPTPQPTSLPSISPTPAPTDNPTKVPTEQPSLTPTISPTFSYDEVTWCHAIIGRSFDTVFAKLSWGLLAANTSDPSLPNSEWIHYTGVIGASGANEIHATHDYAAFIHCNDPTDCWGEAQKSLTGNTGVEIDVSVVTFYAEYKDGGNTMFTTSIINCSIDTPDPSNSPTTDPTGFPTLAPTLGEVWVQLDNLQCDEDRCGCTSSSFDEYPDCCYNACEWDRQPAPVFVVTEKEQSDTTFYVRRNIANYPYTIEIEYNITAVTEALAYEYGFYVRMQQIQSQIKAGNFSMDYLATDVVHDVSNITSNVTSNETDIVNVNSTANGTDVVQEITYTIPDDCYFTDWDNGKCPFYIDTSDVKSCERQNEKNTCTWCDFGRIPGPRCDDIKPNVGTIVIPHTDLSDISGSTFEQAAFELEIKTEHCSDACDFQGEVFLLELTKCTVIENYDNLNEAELLELGANPRDTMTCTLIYPTRAYIVVNDADKTDIVVEEIIENTSYEEWLWYVIAGAAVVIAGLSYVAYIWWRNKKMKEADVAEVEEEMEEVILEQELGWQGGEEVIVGANPLATMGGIGGIQRPVESMGAEYNAKERAKLKDVAQVGIEKFDVRVEYGQQMGDQDGHGAIDENVDIL